MTEDGGAGFIGRADTSTMHDGLLVIDLVTRARTADMRWWDALADPLTGTPVPAERSACTDRQARR